MLAEEDQEGTRYDAAYRRALRSSKPLQGATLVPYVEGNARGVCGAASTATSRQDAQMQ